MKLTKKKILIGLGVLGTIGLTVGAYYLGKSNGINIGKDKVLGDALKMSRDSFKAGYDSGYRKGYNTGYDSIGSKTDIKGRLAYKSGLKDGYSDGIIAGKNELIERLSYPNLSDPYQLKLAMNEGVLINKVGIDEATKAVLNSDPNLEMENYLKNKVMESYNEWRSSNK